MTATVAPQTNINITLPQDVTERAARSLERIGLNLSQALRLFATRLADDERIPFDMLGGEEPNAVTQAAMRELENGGGVLYKNLDDLFADSESGDAPA